MQLKLHRASRASESLEGSLTRGVIRAGPLFGRP